MVDKKISELFGSASNVKILKLFLNNPEKSFTVSEVASKTKVEKRRCRNQINKLEKIGLVQSGTRNGKKKKKEN